MVSIEPLVNKGHAYWQVVFRSPGSKTSDGSGAGDISVMLTDDEMDLLEERVVKRNEKPLKPKPKYAVGTVVGADGEVVVVTPAYSGYQLYARRLIGFGATPLDRWLEIHDPVGHTVFFDPGTDPRFAKYQEPGAWQPGNAEQMMTGRSYTEGKAEGNEY
jgi:hypothetical protein